MEEFWWIDMDALGRVSEFIKKKKKKKKKETGKKTLRTTRGRSQGRKMGDSVVKELPNARESRQRLDKLTRGRGLAVEDP